MARTRGSKNKNSSAVPRYTALTTQERVVMLANLIIDRVLEDQESGARLLAKLGVSNDS